MRATREETVTGEAILSFSLERWNNVWRNRHHIMSRLAHDNKVLFASTPFNIRDAIRTSWNADKEISGVSRITDKLHTYIPPRWLPTNDRYPRLDRIIKDWRCWHIRNRMRRLGMKQPILYIWHPDFLDMVGHFNEALVVYHCYDEFSLFVSNSMRPGAMENLVARERELVRRADIVFTVSEQLRTRRSSLNPNIHVVTNGVNYELFSRAQDARTKIPDDLLAIRRPIIGFVATQTNITDLVLLLQIFQHRQDWSFVFIGVERAPEHQAEEALRALQKLPNVHFIGRRTLEEIPAYLKGCDVCAVPWVLNELSLSASPLKLYEYLAAGKPVVSTPLPHLMHLESVMTFAGDANEWIESIEAALKEDKPRMVQERDKIARENTWDQKANLVSQKLAEALAKRRR